MTDKATRDWKDKVTILITAESIIAGFLIAYGAVNGQLLVDWSRHGGRLMSTYIAGTVINGVVLTSFASILFLLSSIPANMNIENGGELKEVRARQKYYAGYDLFLIAILGTAVFVVTNSFSIYRFTVSLPHLPMFMPVHPLADMFYGEFLLYAIILGLLLMTSLVFNCNKVLTFFARGGGHALFCSLFIGAFIFMLADIFAFWIIVSHLSRPLTCIPPSSAGVLFSHLQKRMVLMKLKLV